VLKKTVSDKGHMLVAFKYHSQYDNIIRFIKEIASRIEVLQLKIDLKTNCSMSARTSFKPV